MAVTIAFPTVLEVLSTAQMTVYVVACSTLGGIGPVLVNGPTVLTTLPDKEILEEISMFLDAGDDRV